MHRATVILLLTWLLTATGAMAQYNVKYNIGYTSVQSHPGIACQSMTDCGQQLINLCAEHQSYCFDLTIQSASITVTTPNQASTQCQDSVCIQSITAQTWFPFTAYGSGNIGPIQGQIQRVAAQCETNANKFAAYNFALCNFGSCPSTRPAAVTGTVCYEGCKATIITMGTFDIEIGNETQYGQTGTLQGVNESCSGFPTVTLSGPFTSTPPSGSGGSSGIDEGNTQSTATSTSAAIQSSTDQMKSSIDDQAASINGEALPTFQSSWSLSIRGMLVPSDSQSCDLTEQHVINLGGHSIPIKLGVNTCEYIGYVRAFFYFAFWAFTVFVVWNRLFGGR